MPFCKLCWISVGPLQYHNSQSDVHLRGAVNKCNDCCRWFSSKAARSRHRSATGCSDPPVSQFHCCECDEDFDTQSVLTTHLNNKIIHPPRVVVVLAPSAGYCEECKKTFSSAKALEQHQTSVIHHPIMQSMTCLGGKGCKRMFHTPSGMLAHLESGACASKLTRDMIDDLVIANDPTNIITDPVAIQTRARDRMMITSSMYTSSTDGSLMFTPSEVSIDSNSTASNNWNGIFTDSNDSDGTITPGYVGSSSDSEADSDNPQFTSSGASYTDSISSSPYGYLPTPSNSSDSSSGVFLTTSNSGSGIFTPTSAASLSSQLITNKFTCPMCPASTKQYKNIDALHVHMRSQIHAAKIYHCPPASLMLGSDHKSTGKQQRSFATLSGLSQHVEAGACEGGKATFNTAMSFVNEKLRNMGLGDLKLVEQ